MPNTLFYTTEIHRRSIVYDASSTSAGDKVNLLDGNLNTYWAKVVHLTSGSHVDIDIYPNQDLSEYDAGRGEASGSAIDTFGFWIKNYDTDYSGAKSFIEGAYSSGSLGTQTSFGSGSIAHDDEALWFEDCTGIGARRFLRISWGGPQSVPMQIGQVFLMRTRTIQTKPEYPIKITPTYYNDFVKMRGGKEYVSAQALNNTYNFDQKYTFWSVANKTAFDNVFHDSNGRLRPLIYQPGDSVTDAYVCRLMQDTLNEAEIDHEFYEAKLKFKTLPYIEDGENF